MNSVWFKGPASPMSRASNQSKEWSSVAMNPSSVEAVKYRVRLIDRFRRASTRWGGAWRR